jgi:hypothetical protein
MLWVSFRGTTLRGTVDRPLARGNKKVSEARLTHTTWSSKWSKWLHLDHFPCLTITYSNHTSVELIIRCSHVCIGKAKLCVAGRWHIYFKTVPYYKKSERERSVLHARDHYFAWKMRHHRRKNGCILIALWEKRCSFRFVEPFVEPFKCSDF